MISITIAIRREITSLLPMGSCGQAFWQSCHPPSAWHHTRHACEGLRSPERGTSKVRSKIQSFRGWQLQTPPKLPHDNLQSCEPIPLRIHWSLAQCATFTDTR